VETKRGVPQSTKKTGEEINLRVSRWNGESLCGKKKEGKEIGGSSDGLGELAK